MKVVVYTSPTCVPCRNTKNALAVAGVEFTEVDVTSSPDALNVLNDLGYMSVPVVVVNDGETHWSGHQPERINGLVA